MDRGVDGEFYFKLSAEDEGRAIISVKGGHNIGPSMIRDLKGTREREDADMGVFLSLETPTAEMRREAATAGFLEPAGFFDTNDATPIPRIQLLTIAEILAGKKPRRPPVYDTQTAAARGRQAAYVHAPKQPDRKQPTLMLPLSGGASKDAPRGKVRQLPLEQPDAQKKPAARSARRQGRHSTTG